MTSEVRELVRWESCRDSGWICGTAQGVVVRLIGTTLAQGYFPSRFGLGFPKKSLASTPPGFTSEPSPNLLPTFTDGYILTFSRD